jgi:ribosomal protein S6
MVIFDTEQDSLENLKKFTDELFKSSKININDIVDMGLRDLSFPINDKRKGTYCLYNVGTDPNNLKEIEQPFKLKKGVLRYFVVRKK